MVESATGYVTNDGTFFKSEREARLYEARVNLEIALREHDVSLDSIDWIDACGKEIYEYLSFKLKPGHNAQERSNEKRNLPNPPKSVKI